MDLTNMKLPNRPRCFITSVGTSLKDNASVTVNEVVSDKEELLIEKFTSSCIDDSSFANIAGAIKKIIIYKKLSAEIKSIEAYPIEKKDKIILISSRTSEAYFSSLALQRYFSENSKIRISANNIEIKVVSGLRSPDDEYFEERGLPDFLNVIIQSIESHQKDYDIVINPTGGYKSLFPYMTIAGIIYGLEVIYVYEESTHLLKIPSLPLHVSVPAWTQMESLIHLLEDKTDYKGNNIYEDNKKYFGPLLFERKIDSKDRLIKCALVEALSKHAKEERGKPELIVRTKNSPLVKLFLADEQRDIFLRLTEIGHLIWKGDKVPEMADHALLHHSDLFHLAERLLLPIFYYKEDFLKPEELLILLCALYLHDCGHVIDRIQRTDKSFFRLLPIEIRDHHHVLGFLRLKHPEIESYMGSLIYDQLCCSGQELWKREWERYIHAVACLGLYHRKKMNLQLPNQYDFYKTYQLTEEEKCYPELRAYLERNTIKVFDKEVTFDRMRLLVSLLRVIDSLDEQTSRTGGVKDIKFHLTQLEVDRQHEMERAETLSLGISKDIKSKIDVLMESLILKFTISEAKGSSISQRKKLVPIDAETFRKKFDEIKSNCKENQNLLFEYASAYLRSFFKRFQIKPYNEKAYIKGIDISSQFDSEIVTVYVDLVMEDDKSNIKELQTLYPLHFEDKELDMINEEDREIFKNTMLDSIKKEYTNEEQDNTSKEAVVRDTLLFHSVKIHYGKDETKE